MKIYWTKYALTTGIIILNVTSTEWDDKIYESNEYPQVYFSDTNKKDWYDTEFAALIRTETLREKKLISLEKQKTKIENIDFTNFV